MRFLASSLCGGEVKNSCRVLVKGKEMVVMPVDDYYLRLSDHAYLHELKYVLHMLTLGLTLYLYSLM